MEARQDWLTQQLAEFLAFVSAFEDEQAAIEGAVERAAEAIEAEVAALLRDGAVVSVVGFPPDQVPSAALVEAAAGRLRTLSVPGMGTCAVLAIPFEDGRDTLVLARSGEPCSPGELVLLRGIARVLSLSLRMMRMVDNERTLRQHSEEQAAENARLLATIKERQVLLERLFEIQRSISHRAPIQEVLDGITKGVGELLGEDVVALRLVDDDGHLRICSSVGVDPDVLEHGRCTPIGEGVGGRVLTEKTLIVADSYADSAKPLRQFVEDGLATAMAAPVYRDGQVVGSLLVASYQPERRYSAAEQKVLLAFAEHASLALNDSSALDAIRQAFADALHRANHDALTGLPNRTLVLDRLGHAIARSSRRGLRPGVLFVDLDRFKAINDSLGHSVGDEVLVCVGERLKAAVRPDDTVARLAGDEFVVVAEGLSDTDLLAVAQRVAAIVAEPLALYGRSVVITASIGIARANAAARAEDVLRDADVAMYRAKERGRARIEIFDSEIRAHMLERIEMEQALRRAVGNGELRLHYQPTYDLQTGEVVGVEALVRWEHPERGLLPPITFVPLAEETGLIVPLGRWVVAEACRQVAKWRAQGSWTDGCQMGINLSARQFADPELVTMVREAAAAVGVAPSCLRFEITETVLMDEAETTAGTFAAIKDLGAGLAIDDFGTGYSSLTYLKRFPVDVLKIDRSFVSGLCTDPEDEVIVAAVISLAHALGLEVVAEGVETSDQVTALVRLGCLQAQGYLLGRPEAPDAVARRLSPKRTPDLTTAARCARVGESSRRVRLQPRVP